MGSEKRYQDCNKLVKLWRRRHYLPIPFMWLFHMTLKPFKSYEFETNEEHIVKGKNLYKVLIGLAQSKMKWYYSHEEVMDRIRRKINNNDKN